MLISILVSPCVMPGTTFGQRSPDSVLSNAPSGSERLTLAGAVDLALRQNLDMRIANIESATRQQDRVIARSELLPHASFEADDGVDRHNLRALLGIQIPMGSRQFQGNATGEDAHRPACRSGNRHLFKAFSASRI